MNINHTLLVSTFLTVASASAVAQSSDADIAKVVVTASPFRAAEGDQILMPAKILSGDELRDKMGSSLGETLSQELGVSASAFGAGASRPIIRGLEGARVKMLENGMAVSDVSGLSNDHAVAAEGAIAQQIEILRGPAALLYGSGAIGGLVNVVNERIPVTLEPAPIGQVEARYSSVDLGRAVSGTVDGTVGQIALHADGNLRRTDNYRIPGFRNVNDKSSAYGILPQSYTRESTGGFGGAYIGNWGHVGASVSALSNVYGIPSAEGSKIDQHQTRYDIDSLINSPLAGFETFKFKVGYTGYKHAELNAEDNPVVIFRNRSLETRWELSHRPMASLHGTFGMQTEDTRFSALNAEGGSDTVPVTHSRSTAGFLVEETDIGPVRMNAGLRLESVKREPVTGSNRSFQLTSYSVGGLWPFISGYGVGATVSVGQRAPATEELYSSGPHDATVTYDIGNPNFRKENSRNIELTVQKSSGQIRWKANVFANHVDDFIFGHITGKQLDGNGNAGGELRERLFEQQAASLRGAEAEVGYNQSGSGWSGRLFADTSSGRLVDGGNLPLQPSTRFGASLGYREGKVRAGISLLHALAQNRLAVFETSTTPAYNQLGANFSYTQQLGNNELTWFALAKNLLNEDIRISTSVLKDISPLPGRSFVFGLRAKL